MSSTTIALKSLVTSSESILPTLTPATLTSSPLITKPALSKIARTLYEPPSEPAPVVTIAAAATASRRSTVATRFTSRPREREARVAVLGPEVAVVGVGRRAVLRALAGGARAAARDVGLQARELVVERLRAQDAPRGVVREGERVEDRLDAGEMAVGVVVGGTLPEVVEPARQLRDVGADELEHGLALLQRLRRVREGGGRDALERGQLARRVEQVVVGAGPRDEPAQVLDRRARAGHERAQLAQERREPLGGGLGLVDERVEVVERGAQVHERGVGAPQRGGQQLERARQRAVLRADRGGGRVRVAHEVGQGVPPLGHRRHRTRGVDDEVGQRPLVLRELVDEPARRREEGVEVLGRLGGLLALALVLRGEALDDALQVPARLRVESVEELVDIDHVGGRAGRQRGAVVQLLRRVGGGGERDVAVGDARERGQADHGLGALAQRRIGLLDLDVDARLVAVRQRDLADGADAAATDLHVVVLDELTGVLEHEVVLVRAASAEEQHGDEHDRERQGGNGHAPGDRHLLRPSARKWTLDSVHG